MTEHAALLDVAREAVAKATEIVRSRPSFSVSAKGDRDLVTDVDTAVEDALREFLSAETPEIGILGEERGLSGDGGDRWWALDPIDGTANFARGIPLCGISLALVEGEHSTVAAIALPYLGVTYTAARGEGTFANGKRVGASTATEISDAMIAVGDFAIGELAEEKNRARLTLLSDLGARAQKIRMLGTAAIDLAWVADGKLDAAVILSNNPWDTMAGVLLVREAGGAVVDRDGSEHTVGSAATIAVGTGLRKEIVDALDRAYGVVR
ncbi:inositol monophosphatase family protein [Amycolatopsis sp. A133]|uniref:inositol monophosphatase family protein n=1 Tax=Amycolatopsis sp. A133 TaxID=3064472 RepID=UPI0027F84805|nr:inositol monophosphatase family protein [Amycolatopsis sp. A133]MDQ7805143.1 inositol monophosphatase family protein [Amycolatopsis sp. A133]